MKKIAIILILLIVANIHSWAQLKGLPSGSSLEKEDIFKLQTPTDKMLTSAIEQDRMPVGNIVEPKYYYLGPGDIISLQVNPIIPYETPLMISPDLTLVLPRGGELSVRNMTLEKLKDTLIHIFKQRNEKVDVNVSLRKARTVIVTISGNVLFPGTYALPSSYRVSTAIKFANQISTDKSLAEEEKMSIQKLQSKARERTKNYSEAGVAAENLYSMRNINLLRKYFPSQNVDIEKAVATGDLSYDPFISEGDEIFVPYEPYQYPKISISGAVHRPVVLPYKQGDLVSYVLRFSYGLRENADIGNVTLYETNKSPRKIKIDKDLNLLEEDFEISPGASIVFGSLPQIQYENLATVSVRGEVQNPGIYPITYGKTRLKDVINNAGGFTSKAYLPLAYITRRQEMIDAYVDYRGDYFSTFQYSDLTMEDTTRFYIDMMLKKQIVSCDFVKAFKENSEIDNVLLYDGDVITVPDNPGYVYVYGQVNHPGYVEFHEGKTMQWYIEKAGGYAQGAAKKRARIIRGKSRVWTEGDENTLVFAGDEIYVPRPPDVPLAIEWQKYGTIASLVSVTVAVIGTLFNIYWVSKNK